MATQRYVSTSFWDDEWIQTLDPSEKLLYLYLMTNPLTNIAGVYKITDRRIGFDTGFNLDTIRHIFAKFEKAGKAYRKDEYVVIPSWPKHQKWEKRSKIREGIVSLLKTLPPDLLGYMVEIGYRYPIDTLSIPYTYHSNYSDSDLDTDSDTDSYGVMSGADEASPPEEAPSEDHPEKPSEPPVLSLPKLGGGQFHVTTELFDAYKEAYHAVDVMSELNKMKAWLLSNKKNLKKDVPRFANSWLARAQDQAVKPIFAPTGSQRPSQNNLGNEERWNEFYEQEKRNVK